MTPDQSTKVMVPFGQIRKAGEARSGTGLGLPLTKAMIVNTRTYPRSKARSSNQAESVAALLAVLGIRIAEVPVTETLITGGLMASRSANVSPRLCNTSIR